MFFSLADLKMGRKKRNTMSSSSPACFVSTIDLSLKDKLEQDLIKQGFSLSASPHAFFSAKKEGISCNLYHSGKITVQGKNKDEFITYYLEPEILKNLSYTYPAADVDTSARVGLDESGKGDFFGPLCIAGLYAEEGKAADLLSLGVRDSKALSDETALKIAKKLKERFPYKVLVLVPETYNRLYAQFHNLNRLLAWGHYTVLQELHKKTSCKKAILDQFADEKLVQSFLNKHNLEVDLTQRVRAEADPVVAAASILARAAFLEGLESLSKKFEISLPKGASSLVITAGKKAVIKHGPEVLSQLAKTHFKTTQAICDA